MTGGLLRSNAWLVRGPRELVRFAASSDLADDAAVRARTGGTNVFASVANGEVSALGNGADVRRCFGDRRYTAVGEHAGVLPLIREALASTLARLAGLRAIEVRRRWLFYDGTKRVVDRVDGERLVLFKAVDVRVELVDGQLLVHLVPDAHCPIRMQAPGSTRLDVEHAKRRLLERRSDRSLHRDLIFWRNELGLSDGFQSDQFTIERGPLFAKASSVAEPLLRFGGGATGPRPLRGVVEHGPVHEPQSLTVSIVGADVSPPWLKAIAAALESKLRARLEIHHLAADSSLASFKHACDGAANNVVAVIPDRWDPALEEDLCAYGLARGARITPVRQSAPDVCALAIAISGRSPWQLVAEDETAAFVGLGYAFDRNAGKLVAAACITSSAGVPTAAHLLAGVGPTMRRSRGHLALDGARALGAKIRASLQPLPSRLVVTREGAFSGEEVEGLREMLGDVPALDLLGLFPNPAQRHVAWDADERSPNGKAVPRGTIVPLEEGMFLVYLTGHATRGVRIPLCVRRFGGTTSIETLASELIGLTKMAFVTFDPNATLPAHVRMAAMFARANARNPDRELRLAQYLHLP